MNHSWKTASLQGVIKYNRGLLIVVIILSFSCMILSLAIIAKEDKWVLIPCNDIDRKLEISNSKLYPSYLKEWAVYIAKEIFTTSPDEVEEQHAKIRKISSTNKELKEFFSIQLNFIKTNSASSVFFLKAANPIDDGILVKGTLHYWFAGSDRKVALEKTYKISYKQAARGLVLLTNIEEHRVE